MPRFRFHIRSKEELIEDEEGANLVDLAAAIDEAVKGARSLIGDDVLNGFLDLDQRIEIVDENGERVATVKFADAIEIISGSGVANEN
jgi:hypothetical protein